MILTDKDAKPLSNSTDQFKTVELNEKYLNLSVPHVTYQKNTKRIANDSTIRQSPGMIENTQSLNQIEGEIFRQSQRNE